MTSVDNAQGHMTKKCELEMYFSLKGFDIFPCLPSDLCDFTFSVPARLPSDHGAGRSQASRPSEEIRYCKQTNQWNNKKKISATPLVWSSQCPVCQRHNLAPPFKVRPGPHVLTALCSVCCAAQCVEDNKPHLFHCVPFFPDWAHQSHSRQLSLSVRRFIKQPQLGLIATNWHIIFY